MLHVESVIVIIIISLIWFKKLQLIPQKQTKNIIICLQLVFFCSLGHYLLFL